jgi:hypothetical protein
VRATVARSWTVRERVARDRRKCVVPNELDLSRGRADIGHALRIAFGRELPTRGTGEDARGIPRDFAEGIRLLLYRAGGGPDPAQLLAEYTRPQPRG